MTDKELNNNIFSELFKMATLYFNDLFKDMEKRVYTIKEVNDFILNHPNNFIVVPKQIRVAGINAVTTSKELAKEAAVANVFVSHDGGGNAVINCDKIISGQTLTIEIGSFKCSFDKNKVFDYLERYKKLSGAKTKLVFSNAVDKGVKKESKDTVCSFTVSFDKDLKAFANVKTQKSYIGGRIYENNVMISTRRNELFSTNAFAVKRKDIVINNYLGNEKPEIAIPFETFRKIAGKKCEITVSKYPEGDLEVDILETATNEMYTTTFHFNQKELPIEGIYPTVYKELQVVVTDPKTFINEVKRIDKSDYYNNLCICFKSGSDKAKLISISGETNYSETTSVEYIYNELTVNLKEPAGFTCCVTFKSYDFKIVSANWNGTIYIGRVNAYGMAYNHSILLGDKFAKDSLIMLSNNEERDFNKYVTEPYYPKNLTIQNNHIPSQKEEKVTVGQSKAEPVKTDNTKDRNEIIIYGPSSGRQNGPNVFCFECEPEDVSGYWDHLDNTTMGEISAPDPDSFDAPTGQSPERVHPVEPIRELTIFLPERPADNCTAERLRLFPPTSQRFLITAKGMYYLIT